ncbi:MAG: sulfotransferase domain-containing protein [Gammaproteobacteria bacterium]
MSEQENNAPVFIVGIYKCGTSWLLRVLDQHPAMRGIRELDLLKAGAGDEDNGDKLLGRNEVLFNYFGVNLWSLLRGDTNEVSKTTEILLKHTGTDSIKAIFDLPAEQAVDAIVELLNLKLKQKVSAWAPVDKKPLFSFLDLPRQSLVALYERIAVARSVYEAGDAFIEAVRKLRTPEQVPVLKAADQIARYDYLRAWKPAAKKIAIVRDGRDAAISAMHYRNLMRSLQSAYLRGGYTYWECLDGWSSRIRMLMHQADDENLAVIRYEDLTMRFMETATALFEWLGAYVDDGILEQIHEHTKFESLTGRKPGESAPHVMRKGVIGEWKEAISQDDASQTWKIAGEELAALGYTESGEIGPLRIPQHY